MSIATSDTKHVERQASARNERLLAQHRRHKGPYSVQYDSYVLDMLPGVFNPCYGEGSQLMLQCRDQLSTGTVLDMGTGSGALALLASETAEEVVACDVSEVAVRCARSNVRRNGRSDTVRVQQSNLFDAIPDHCRFDQIIFNTPFLSGTARTPLERCIYDHEYETLSRFLGEANQYLTPGGSILLCFGNVGNISYLTYLAEENGFRFDVIADQENRDLVFFVYQMTVEN